MKVSLWILRIVLILAGLAVMFTGINISFGGITTLGLQGTADFIQVIDRKRFLAQDSHIRFLGGIWLSIGAMFVIGAFRLINSAAVLKFCFAAIFAGGVARFTQMDTSVTLGADILPSLIAEIIIMPVLYIWLNAFIKQSKSA